MNISIASASSAPRCDMAIEISRISSSSSPSQMAPAYLSPRSSISMAARSTPRRTRVSSGNFLVGSLLIDTGGMAKPSTGRLGEPCPDQGQGLAGIVFDQFADALDRFLLDGAVDLGDLQQLQRRT